MGELAQPKGYDVHKARCVSWNDMRRMLADDGPTRANLMCLVDCLQYGHKKQDTFRPPVRTAHPGAPATHDSVVAEVINRIGAALGGQISESIRAALAAAGIAPTGENQIEAVPAPPNAGGNGGGNGAEAHAPVMEPPPVPVGYHDPRVHQPSEVFGKPEDVNPDDFQGGLALAEDATDLAPQPHPKPLTEAELANLRSILASGQAPAETTRGEAEVNRAAE